MGLGELFDAIKTWVSEALPKATIKPWAPGTNSFDDDVAISFLAFRQTNEMRHTRARRDPVIDQLEVDCLIMPRNSDPLRQSTMLAELHFAAMRGAPGRLAGPDVERQFLSQLSLPPGSGLILTATLRRQREERNVALVKEAVFDINERQDSSDVGT